jgi:hypothetical protein
MPRPRRAEPKKKPSLFTLLLNTFMIVSGVALTYVVLVREEQYAFAQTDHAAMFSAEPQETAHMTGQFTALPPR